MTMRELLVLLESLEIAADNENLDTRKLKVSGFLLGDGIRMDIKNAFIDGSTLHLDFIRST
jgi:ribosomal protein L22